MKYAILATTAAAMFAGSAFAADLPSKKEAPAAAPASTDGFDLAFGAKVMSDYISRGVTQSNHEPSATFYVEPRYNIGDTQLYVGTQLWRTVLPTAPLGELDLYGGVRQTWGKFSVDLGAIYYDYPNNKNQYFTSGTAALNGNAFAQGNTVLNPLVGNAATCLATGLCATTAKDPSFLEIYLKPSYNFTDSISLAGNAFYSPNWGNYASNGGKGGFQSLYLSLLPKYTFGDSGFSVSAETGYRDAVRLVWR